MSEFTVIHFRYSNAFVYTLIVLTAVAVGQGTPVWWPWLRRSLAMPARMSSYAMRLALVVLLAAPLVAGAIEVARAHLAHGDELLYLRWLATAIPEASVILTSGNVDPWEVHEVTGRSVIWPAENGGWQFITEKPYRWSRPVRERFPDAGTQEILNRLRAAGDQLWFYRPGGDDVSQAVRLILGFETAPRSFRLDPVIRYPADPDRAAYRVGEPVEP